MDFVKLGDHLQKLREKAGLSQAKLAGRLEISGAALSYIESGETKVGLERLEQILKAIGARGTLTLESVEHMSEGPPGSISVQLPPDMAEAVAALLAADEEARSLGIRAALLMGKLPESHRETLGGQLTALESRFK